VRVDRRYLLCSITGDGTVMRYKASVQVERFVHVHDIESSDELLSQF
jgi:hypothetical protein